MQPQELEAIEKHTQALNAFTRAIESNNKPVTPLDKTYWLAEKCAGYLDIDVQTFRNQYASSPLFPCPIRLKTASGKSHPRWNAQKVIDWVDAHAEEVARRRKPRK